MDAVLQRDPEIALTDREMDRIVRLVYERSGIALHRGKRALVVARLHKLLKYDYVNKKVLAFDMAGVQIANAVDLSGYTAGFVAFGK